MRLVALKQNADGTFTLYKILLLITEGETRMKIGEDLATFKTNVAAFKYCRTYGYIIMEAE